MEPAPIGPDEVPDYVRRVFGAFHVDVPDDDIERWQRLLEPERTLVLRDRGSIVAGAGIFSRRVTVPGGDVPAAAVTAVGVRPTHRRRGMLTTLMRRQLADIHDDGREAVAALWASEPVIYGRFGYGMATTVAELRVDLREARLRTSPTLQAELLAPRDALAAMRAIHEEVRARVPGMLDRDDRWWDDRIDDPEREREGAEPLRAVVFEGAAYALYAVKPHFEMGRPAGEVVVRELVAATPAGSAAAWGFLLGLDLTRTLVWELGPADEPLHHMLTSPTALRTRVDNALWLRVVDLPRALRERAYGPPFEVVLEVADEVCPWNAGRWALRWDGTTATCAPTSTPAALELSSTELGAAYLGGATLERLARAGRVRELRPGALAAASRAFSTDRAPWCPEIF